MSVAGPVVSIIIPAYNAEDSIGACLSGALTQSYPYVEIVVVDDGSTDRTGEICRAYGPRLRYVWQETAGSAAARNTAFAHTRGEFIAFCDADDVLLPAYVQTALDAYKASGGGRRIVMCEALQLTSTGLAHGRRLIGPHFPRRRQRLAILQKNFVPIFSIFPRQLLDDVSGLNEELWLVEDWEFWIRAILVGWSVVFQSVPQAVYRLSPAAKSADEGRHAAEDRVLHLVRDRYGDILTNSERVFLERRLSAASPRLLDQQAKEALRRRRYKVAARLHRQLAALSSEDPRVRIGALILGYLPTAGHFGRWRQVRLDRRLGGRLALKNGRQEPRS